MRERTYGALGASSFVLALIATAAVLSLFASHRALLFPYAWLVYLSMEIAAIVLSSIGLARKSGGRVLSLLALTIACVGVATIPYLFWFLLGTAD